MRQLHKKAQLAAYKIWDFVAATSATTKQETGSYRRRKWNMGNEAQTISTVFVALEMQQYTVAHDVTSSNTMGGSGF
jgi:hypothetical protein